MSLPDLRFELIDLDSTPDEPPVAYATSLDDALYAARTLVREGAGALRCEDARDGSWLFDARPGPRGPVVTTWQGRLDIYRKGAR